MIITKNPTNFSGGSVKMRQTKFIGISVFLFMLLSVIVMADDLYGYIGLYADNGDVYVNIDSNADNGSVYNFYNGEQLVQPEYKSSKMSDNTFYSKIGDIFHDYSYSSREWRAKTEFATYTQQIAHDSFNMHFMPRKEVYEELGKLKFEILVLQEQVKILQPYSSVFKTECEIRKELMIEYGLPSVKCKSQTFVNHEGVAVTLESLIVRDVDEYMLPEYKIVNSYRTYSKDMVDRFEELCDGGALKFCKVLEVI